MLTELARAAAAEIREAAGRRVEARHVFDVSALADCPAQAVAERLAVEPSEPGARLYARYLAELGAVFHAALQAELGLVHGYSAEVPVEDLVEHERLGTILVKGRADVVLRDAVVEVKTSAGLGKLKEPGPRLWAWLLQLLFYADALGKGKAVLLVFDRCRPRYGYLVLEGEELHRAAPEAREIIRKRAVLAAEVVEKGDPWRVGIPGPWCRHCPWRTRCAAFGVFGLDPRFRELGLDAGRLVERVRTGELK